jgi:hypothetical protein
MSFRKVDSGNDRKHRSASEYERGEKEHREAAHYVTASRLS